MIGCKFEMRNGWSPLEGYHGGIVAHVEILCSWPYSLFRDSYIVHASTLSDPITTWYYVMLSLKTTTMSPYGFWQPHGDRRGCSSAITQEGSCHLPATGNVPLPVEARCENILCLFFEEPCRIAANVQSAEWAQHQTQVLRPLEEHVVIAARSDDLRPKVVFKGKSWAWTVSSCSIRQIFVSIKIFRNTVPSGHVQ